MMHRLFFTHRCFAFISLSSKDAFLFLEGGGDTTGEGVETEARGGDGTGVICATLGFWFTLLVGGEERDCIRTNSASESNGRGSESSGLDIGVTMSALEKED